MLFSVLIPVYNTSKYLEECIHSVLLQTEKDYEIVLIDDGSTDNSGDICDRYANEYSFIRVIHKRNEGLMMTRRRGFQEARGEYFICLDSDDYLCDNDAFAKIKRMIVENGCDLVVYNYLMEKGPGEQDKAITLFDLPDGYIFEGEDKQILYNKTLIGGFFNNMWIKAPKRDCVDIDVDYSQWQPLICRGEDLFQSYPILNNAKKIGYINSVLLHYRWTESSISNNPKLKFYDAYKTIYMRQEEYIRTWSISDKIAHESRIKQIPMILEIVTGGYNAINDNITVDEWNTFIERLSKDEYIHQLFSSENTKEVIPFYRLLGALIKGNHKLLLGRVIQLQHIISSLRHRKHKV